MQWRIIAVDPHFANNSPNKAVARHFFEALLQSAMEGFFADPIYGGNRNKAGWKMIGFPGVIATHAQDIIKYKDKKFPADYTSIADMS